MIDPSSLPTMSQWVSYLRTRPEARASRCVRCTQPVSFLDRQPARGVRGTSSLQRYRRSEQDLGRIKVGTLVKTWEEEVILDPATGDIIDTILKRKIVPMMTAGMGCPACQWMMAQAVAGVMWESEVAEAEYKTLWVRDRKVYGRDGMALPTIIAQHTLPALREIKVLLTPTARTPFIDVSEDVNHCPKGGRRDAVNEVKVMMPVHGPLALGMVPALTQSHLLHQITESLGLDLIENDRPASDLGRAATIAAHLAFRVDQELHAWRIEAQSSDQAAVGVAVAASV